LRMNMTNRSSKRRKTVVTDSNFAVAHYELGQAYVQKHMYNEGIAELQKAIVLS
jgi:hypothetical protein